MISKVFDGHSFYHASRYVCSKSGAEVLEAEGVRGYDYRLMADDFNVQHEMRPSKTQACFHAVLSFYPGEDLGNEKMIEIAREYLRKIGITNTQYVITKHTDKAHLHLHIIANMVNNDGKSISDSYIGYRGKKAAQQLTQQYDLIPAIKKDLSHTNLDALSESEANRYVVFQSIQEVLPKCNSLEDLERMLAIKGISVQYKYKGQTSEKQGISFKIGDDCFKGSKVDRRFSLAGLTKTIEQQAIKNTRRWTLAVPDRSLKRPISIHPKQTHKNLVKEIIRAVAKGVVQVLSELNRPIEHHDTGLSHWFKPKKKKKEKVCNKH